MLVLAFYDFYIAWSFSSSVEIINLVLVDCPPSDILQVGMKKKLSMLKFDSFDEALAELSDLINNHCWLTLQMGWRGWNCRKMENLVWDSWKLWKRNWKKDFVLVSLYVDDKVCFPEERKVFEYMAGRRIEEEKKSKIK